MAISGLGLPIDVQWRLIAVSPDMMDTTFCNRAFPYAWRSSLAISVYEPTEDELPEHMCGHRLTYLKVTANITGYEPTEEETKRGYTEFPTVPTEKLDALLRDYFGCYGALINVAVFTGPKAGEVSSTVRTDVDFANRLLGKQQANPLRIGDAEFTRPGNKQDNEVVDLYPQGGDGNGELSLGRRLEVTVPASSRVVARMVTFAGPVTMTAYAGKRLVAEVESGPEQNVEHELEATGEGITRVVLVAPQNEASLLSLSYWVRSTRPATLADYPHIVDFEPKNRDLYQAASQNGEILTSSTSQVNVDKSMTTTESTETGLSHTGKYTSPQSPYGQMEASHTISHKWGETTQDATNVGIDGLRDRRERHGSTTSITQMYSLLTGYHVGTNRASFLMLPRPHLLQPTERRTFVRGLRVIEGVQEFFLVVERGPDVEGLCIEARLETGHFPEKVDIQVPPTKYAETTERWIVTAHADDGAISGSKEKIEADPSATYTAPAGWVIDRTKGDSGHAGLTEVANLSNAVAEESLDAYNYRTVSDASALVSGTIQGRGLWRGGAIFERHYDVHLRSQEPMESSEQPKVDTPLLITSRELCVCYRLAGECPEVVTDSEPARENIGRLIVDEARIALPPVSQPDVLATDALRQVGLTMANSWRMPSRRPPGTVGYLESDYFTEQVAEYLPPTEGPVADLLTTDLGTLSLRSGLEPAELARLRRDALAPREES